MTRDTCVPKGLPWTRTPRQRESGAGPKESEATPGTRGMGVAVGAETDQRVIHYSGDGGMGYNIAELETMVRRNDEHVPWVVVVNNNSSFGMGAIASRTTRRSRLPT